MLRTVAALLFALSTPALFAAQQGASLTGPQPLFPANNWWNTDISQAPVDANSANFIAFIGSTKGMHPDFGGDAGGGDVYGFPVITVDGRQPKKTVDFVDWPDQSDGVDHTTETPVPFYPVPDEAISLSGWVEGGQPGNVDQRADADRHLLIVDQPNNRLYELFNVWFDGTNWEAGSGAAYYMNRNDRRPDTWTSADAAGLAILPGLVRYDEVNGPYEIRHAFRITVRSSNGYVYPASHNAGSAAGALPMGARLRLKASKNISALPADVQKVARAMKRYGLIVADNGTDLYISGTYDVRWNNDVLNPAFSQLKGSDFEVVQLGWAPPVALVASMREKVPSGASSDLTLTAYDVNGNVVTGYTGTVQITSTDGAATLPSSYTFTGADAGRHTFPHAVTLRTIGAQVLTVTDAATPTITGSRAAIVTSTLPPSSPLSTYWACFHYATKTAADAHLANVNLNATLVSTGFGDYPWVVIEKWGCGSCSQNPAPIFTAVAAPAGYVPTSQERLATGTDGTVLVVRRINNPLSATQRRLTTNGGE